MFTNLFKQCGWLQMVSVISSLLLLLTLDVNGQARSVSGKVTDEGTGESLPGVNVIVKGTTTGTVTDIDGQYQLEVSEGATLVFSFVGYKSQEIAVGDRQIIDVMLNPDLQSLEEVVVIGYGTQRKSDVTGAVSLVSSKELQEVPVANMQQALQGRAAGVEVQRVGTAPGAPARIRIRGQRSINGSNDPLIVLDGIPYEGSISDINPDEIASINILKDASATAIYGSRGANGVILVTTKRGHVGETRLTFNSYYGISTVARKYDLFNAEEYATMRDISGYTDGYEPEEIEGMALGRNTDWQDLMYEDGYITNHNLGIRGGNEKSQYAISAGYFKETTILPGQDFERYSLKSTFDTEIANRLKIGLNSMNSMSYRNGAQFVNQQPNTPGAFGGSVMYPILALSPLMPAYEENGEIFLRPAGNQTDKAGQYNPLLLKENNNNWTDQIRRFRSFNSAFAEVEIVEGLKYRFNLGLDFSQANAAQFQGQDSYFRPAQGNRARVRNEEQFSWTAENLLIYDKTFDDHHITFTGLYSAQQSKTWSTLASKDSISADFIQFYDLGISSPSSNLLLDGGEETWGLISYMARVNYSFKDRYLLTLTYRRDGSSRLANKWHNYPAVALGWNMTKEPFLQNQEIVSTLKLRVGYGQTSNQAVAPYTTLGGVTPDNGSVPIRYNYGSQRVVGYLPARIPDKSLDWEYTDTWNVGVDFGVLQNRITGSLEWYNAQTNNLLYNFQLPITSGYQDAFQTNLGSVENRGVEVSLSAAIIESGSDGGFTWSADLNWSMNRNKLLELAPGEERNIGNGLHVGHPLTAIYDFKKLGIWQEDEADEAALFGQVPGELRVADLSGPEGEPDGVLSEEYDREVIGSQQADWQGGITNRFTFKGFDLSIVTYARIGGLLMSYLHAPNGAYLTNNNGIRSGLDVDYWTPENPTNWFPAPNSALPGGASGSWSTLAYYDASFVRVRSINLGYTLPSSLVSRINAQSLRIYVTAQNPFLLYAPYVTKWNGVDPEPTGQGGTGIVNGDGLPFRTQGENQNLVISASTPPTRSFILGINVTF